MEFKANTVLVTGGGSGIGFALAERFVQAGSDVIICGRREGKLKEAQSKYPQMHIRVCDVANPTERKALFTWVSESFPELNILVNNAGIQQRIQLKEKSAWETLGQEVAINLEAPIHLSTLFIPHLLQKNGLQSLMSLRGLPLYHWLMCLSIAPQKRHCIRLRFRCDINLQARRSLLSKSFRPLLIPISGAKVFTHSVPLLMNSRMLLWNNLKKVASRQPMAFQRNRAGHRASSWRKSLSR